MANLVIWPTLYEKQRRVILGASLLGVDPARCAVVEDSVTGVTAGEASGATVYGFSSVRAVSLGLSDPQALRAAGAVEIFALWKCRRQRQR